ncbi:L-proline glycine betaine ABC transport system permease protein ProV [Acidisarcina polymorpha]|uniref:L-proline glycine betaine ABC transport system permease protein ProV n=1 Tax=Acidisarcina polymorpha TaxID=2211140 RepID=A0A2Z5FRT8_9BACT|nr:ATP-binding cassette domain-containing protein [Acidisarcina polymorpha]AXC09398.1 L-proline glycine betaine ABC transport system permease protein ProV [Acidisarcina polymorpha]
MPDAAIEFRDVTFKTPQNRVLLDKINLTISSGSTVAILGRSGSGKTTLLRTVNRMVEPTSGEVLVEGKPITASDPVMLRRGIGYVVQETGLFPHFKIERNIGTVLELAGKPKSEIEDRSRQLMQMVGLDAGKFAGRYPHQLSGGQRQRVGLARALAADPPVLLMDEPFGALDPLTRAEMQDVLRELMAGLKKTILLVTHDLDEAMYLASRILLIEDGRVAADLESGEFLNSKIPQVSAYTKAVHRGDESAAGQPR